MQSINRAARRRSRREIAKHPQWGTLEEFARGRIQSWRQDVLEEEVAELLGRGKSQRRGAGEAPASAGTGVALREQAAAAVRAPNRSGQRAVTPALPSRARPRRFRTGVARAARRRCAALGLVDRAAACEVAPGVRDVAKPAAGPARGSIRLGRWSLCQSGS